MSHRNAFPRCRTASTRGSESHSGSAPHEPKAALASKGRAAPPLHWTHRPPCSAASRVIAARLLSTSSSHVAQEQTLMRIAV